MDPIRCPKCGGEIVTKEMWGWVDPATGKYVPRFLSFRVDTLVLSLAMFGAGILYVAFYLVAVPGYLVWRSFTRRRYSVRRTEYICEECDHSWNVDRAR